MEYTWLIPEPGSAKISIHLAETDAPLPNGNINGLGIIVRDHMGNKIWGALGPVPGMTEHQALVWGAQAGIIHSVARGFPRVHIDTINREIYDFFRLQEVIILPPDLDEAFRHLNFFYANHFDEEISEIKVSIIPVEQNATAEYMAIYGLQNLSTFAEATETVGNLQYFLDRDMGIALPYPDMEPNLGLGEVIDASPPASPTQSVVMDNTIPDLELPNVTESLQVEAQERGFNSIPSFQININLNVIIHASQEGPSIPTPNEQVSQAKGKRKILASYIFNNDGLMSMEAINIIDAESLIPLAKCFQDPILDLEKEIFPGIFAKDILETAVKNMPNLPGNNP